MARISIQPSILEQISASQEEDEQLSQWLEKGIHLYLARDADVLVRLRGCLFILTSLSILDFIVLFFTKPILRGVQCIQMELRCIMMFSDHIGGWD